MRESVLKLITSKYPDDVKIGVALVTDEELGTILCERNNTFAFHDDDTTAYLLYKGELYFITKYRRMFKSVTRSPDQLTRSKHKYYER